VGVGFVDIFPRTSGGNGLYLANQIWAERLGELTNHHLAMASRVAGIGTETMPTSLAVLERRNGGGIDVVLVDGLAGLACARVAPRILSPNGFIVRDDLHYVHLAEARDYLSKTMEGTWFWGVRPFPGAWGGTGFYARNLSLALAATSLFRANEGATDEALRATAP
jgi:hypothetical protein